MLKNKQRVFDMNAANRKKSDAGVPVPLSPVNLTGRILSLVAPLLLPRNMKQEEERVATVIAGHKAQTDSIDSQLAPLHLWLACHGKRSETHPSDVVAPEPKLT